MINKTPKRSYHYTREHQLELEARRKIKEAKKKAEQAKKKADSAKAKAKRIQEALTSAIVDPLSFSLIKDLKRISWQALKKMSYMVGLLVGEKAMRYLLIYSAMLIMGIIVLFFFGGLLGSLLS